MTSNVERMRIASFRGRDGSFGSCCGKALVTVRASQGGFGVLRKLGPRGLSGPAGGEENFEFRAF